MHKDELLELHEELVVIMEYFSEREEVDETLFDHYRQLDVDPRTSTSQRVNTNTRSSSSATRSRAP